MDNDLNGETMFEIEHNVDSSLNRKRDPDNERIQNTKDDSSYDDVDKQTFVSTIIRKYLFCGKCHKKFSINKDLYYHN